MPVLSFRYTGSRTGSAGRAQAPRPGHMAMQHRRQFRYSANKGSSPASVETFHHQQGLTATPASRRAMAHFRVRSWPKPSVDLGERM
jgi:hypothetical protein